MPPDCELLRLYVESSDDSAFAELVRRHVDVVYSVALRVLNGDTHLAEDVTQAVFTQCARHASALAARPSIMGWLHTTARFTAIKAVRTEQRRRGREQEAFIMQQNSSGPDLNWEQLRPLLDEAIGRLGEQDREAVLLRFFKGLSYHDVGVVLNLGEDAARKRVDRALEKLHGQFARRGVTLASALLGAAISTHSVQAAPAGLAARSSGLAPAAVTGGLGLGLKILFMSTKTKIALVLVLVGVISATLAVTLRHPASPPPSSSAAPVTTPITTNPTQQSATAVAAKPAAPAKVEAPVVAAVTAASSSGKPAPAAAQSTVDARSSLDTAIPEAVRLLQAQDYEGFFKEFISPDELQTLGMTSDQLLAYVHSKLGSGFQQSMDAITNDLENIETQPPTLSADGAKATFNTPKNHGDVGASYQVFNKVNGLWYFELR